MNGRPRTLIKEWGIPVYVGRRLAAAFVARWCAVTKVETSGGVFHEDEPGTADRGSAASDNVRAG
jgi:hypothetical protein